MTTEKVLTNEQIARVFAMYLHCQVEYDSRIGNIVTYYVSCGDIKKQIWIVSLEDVEFKDNELSCSADIRDCKLLLTPLSAISDEDAIEVDRLIFGDGFWRKECYTNGFVVKRIIDDLFAKRPKDISFIIAQYLIQKGYAVPLFIEAGHPDNGKTAIELGIAIDKSTIK